VEQAENTAAWNVFWAAASIALERKVGKQTKLGIDFGF
jgi:hypothetical protein